MQRGNSKRTTHSLSHSQSHQAQNTVEHTKVNKDGAWTKEEIREVIWCYMYCRQHFTENYKKVYEMRRQCSPEFGMVMEQPYCALHTYFRKYQCKNTIRFNTETNDINTMNSNNRIAATLYSLGT